MGPWLRSLGGWLTPSEKLEPMRVTGGMGRGLVLELYPATSSPFTSGEVEPEVSEALARYASPGTVVYDLGANLGYFALSMARSVGPAGRVFAFEADPEMADRLERNVKVNGIQNLTLIRAAVWSDVGHITFSRSDPSVSPDRGLGHIETERGPRDGDISVPTVTLDVFSMSEPPPGLIKCDVEGAEVEVFQGALDVLTRARPVVVCEMHTPEKGARLDSLFRSLGYSSEWLDGSHLLARPADA